VQAAALKLKVVEFPVPLVYLDEDRSFGGSLDIADRRLAYYREVLDREISAMQLGCDAAPRHAVGRPALCGSAP